MDILLDKKDSTNASIKVTLNEADYQPKVEEKLKEYSRKASIKGFRPGKVPAGLIKKMYGKSILVDEINSLLMSSVDSYIKENQLPIVGDPLPEVENAQNIDWDTQKQFEFSYTVGLVPEFKVDLDNLSLTTYEIEVTDKEIDELIEKLQQRHGERIHPDTVQEGDAVYGELKQVDGTFAKENVFLALDRLNEAVRATFVGKAKEDTVAFDIATSFEKPEYVEFLTGLPKEEAAALTGSFEITIKDIERTQAAELNQDFFDKVVGKESVDSEETFRTKLRELVTQDYKKEAEQLLSNQVLKQIVDKTEIELPNEFLKRWLKVTNDNLTVEQIEQEYDLYVRELKWSLIKNKIAQENDVKVEHEEVLAKTKELISGQFGMASMADDAGGYMDTLADSFLKAEKGKNYMNIFNRVFADRVTEYIKSKAPVTSQTVSTDEFNKIAGEQG